MKVVVTTMLILIYLSALASLTGCSTETSQRKSAEVIDDSYYGMKTVKIRDCEYIRSLSYGGYYSYTHAGDCSNSIHQPLKSQPYGNKKPKMGP